MENGGIGGNEVDYAEVDYAIEPRKTAACQVST